MSLLKTRFLKYMSRDRRDTNTNSTDADTTAITVATEEKQRDQDQESNTRDLPQPDSEQEERQIEHFLESDDNAREDSADSLSQTPELGSSEELDDGIIPLVEDHNIESNEAPNVSDDTQSDSDPEDRSTNLSPNLLPNSNHHPIPERKCMTTPSDRSSNLRSRSSQNTEQSTAITISTTTTPKTYDIEWLLDEDSIRIGSAKNKRRGRDSSSSGRDSSDDEASGVIEALFVVDSHRFKLELCITGWINSNRGYAAFYLTIPQGTGSETGKSAKTKCHDGRRLVARFSVTIKDTDKSKTSSIRDDFHLGVGFPNLCSEKVLRESAKRNGGTLALSVKIEIFHTESRVNQLDEELYNLYAKHFGVEPKMGTILSSKSSGNDIQNNVLAAMWRDRTFCDVTIQCKKVGGESASILVHKCVLLHSSVVFQRMFSSFVEGQDNVINLEQSLWSHHIIEQLVHFLYFAEIETMFCREIESLFQLFQVAEYYAISTLVTECCNQFILTLSPETVTYLLLKLETDALRFDHVEEIQFIRKHDILWQYATNNIVDVKQTKYYQQMLYSAPQILNQLIDKMTTNY